MLSESRIFRGTTRLVTTKTRCYTGIISRILTAEQDVEHYDPEEAKSPITLEDVMTVLRLLAAAMGIVVVVIGVLFAMKMFYAIFAALQAPKDVQPLLEQWISVLGKDELDLTIGKDTLPLARILATVVLGGGAVVLTWIAMGLIVTGAKVVSWTTSDREAIKRILRDAFGAQGKPR